MQLQPNSTRGPLATSHSKRLEMSRSHLLTQSQPVFVSIKCCRRPESCCVQLLWPCPTPSMHNPGELPTGQRLLAQTWHDMLGAGEHPATRSA